MTFKPKLYEDGLTLNPQNTKRLEFLEDRHDYDAVLLVENIPAEVQPLVTSTALAGGEVSSIGF